jgi:hypothetical protein
MKKAAPEGAALARAARRRKTRAPRTSVIVGALAVIGDIEALAFGIDRHA